MSRRIAWVVGSVAAALVLAGAALWMWQASSDHPSPDGPASADATASPAASHDPQELAQQRLDDVLEECTSEESVGGAVPEGCGIRIPWGTEFAHVDGIRFRIERMPVLELTGGGFVADGGVLVATVTGTGQDGAARTETYRTESWSVRGEATIAGDRVDLDVW